MPFDSVRKAELVHPLLELDPNKSKGIEDQKGKPVPRQTDLLNDQTQQPETGVISMNSVREAVDKLNNSALAQGKKLSYRIDSETHRIVVKIINTETDKVIRQIPPEETLHLAAQIDHLRGLMLNENS